MFSLCENICHFPLENIKNKRNLMKLITFKIFSCMAQRTNIVGMSVFFENGISTILSFKMKSLWLPNHINPLETVYQLGR